MHIKLKDGSTRELPDGSSAKDLAEQLNLRGPDQALAAKVNGKIIDLNRPLSEGDTVILLNFEDQEGCEVFWHTSAHILAQAVLRLFPDAKPTIGPPIDKGFYYDFANLEITEEDLLRIENEMKAIVKENYISEREVLKGKKEALQAFKDNPYKCELIRDFSEEDELTAYRQGEFYDLCRGPHLPNLGKVKALKVTKTSGAYWRGDSQNEMLTRIYAISYPDRKQLKEYLHFLEEAKKRDHRIIGSKLDLFSMREEAPGMPFFHPNGLFIWQQLVGYARKLLIDNDYEEIKTPIMMTKELWEKSGHWENYRESMYTSETHEREFAIKPMNCPGCMLYYSRKNHSYRELPLRIGEIGTVHRNEASGAVAGLFRVRCFHQDDAHIFMKPDDIESEIIKALELYDQLYKAFDLEYHLELSTRPEKNTIGNDEEWEQATQGLKNALDHSGRPYVINEGDGAFYGPKIDFHVRDALQRTWQCGTIQLDMSLPRRFDLEYTASDGSRQRPIMIHRAIYGSIERFLGIIIEHFAGKFPLWLNPQQIRILPVADRHIPYAQELKKIFQNRQFQCTIDDANESVSKKVRNAQLDQVSYILTVGDQEVEHQTINLRTRDNAVHGEINPTEFIEKISYEKDSYSLQSPYKKEKVVT